MASMDKDEIIEELNKHICGYSFINVISFACLNEIISYYCCPVKTGQEFFEIIED